MTAQGKTGDFWVLDISNSFTKLALVQKGKLGKPLRHPTSELTIAWFRDRRRERPNLPIVVASVVPTRTERMRRVFGDSALEVRGDLDLGFPIEHPRKREIGADRLANAAAGRYHYGAPVVVVDFGTAVTFDVVDARGAYCGGVIAIGLNAMTDYLHERTALLPKVAAREPRQMIGKSTAAAMQVGAVIGYRGLVREILAGLARELRIAREDMIVIFTGGHARLVAQGMRKGEIQAVNPLLTLDGLRIIGLYRGWHR